MSETNGKPNIYQRINAIMKEIGYVQKDKKNSFMNFRYVSHDAVTASLRPFLVNHGVVVTCDIVNHDVKEIATGKSDRPDRAYMTSVTAQVSFINIDNPDDRIVVHSIGQGIDKNDLGPGKAVSYAYKYALLKTLALETGDDPENDGNDKPKPPQPQSQQPSKNNGGNQAAAPDNDVERELNKLAVELFGEVNHARRVANKKGFVVFEDFAKAFRKHCVEAKTPGITLKKLSAIRSHKEAAVNVMVQLNLE